MPNLHAHFYLGNVKQFRQELDTSTNNHGASSGKGAAAAAVGSAGRSWGAAGMEMRSAGGKTDPNERDSLGRTVLHLAASSMNQQSYSFFSTLLRNPNISVNLQDYESGHTALHRALYVGNIRAARDLLMRHDIDPSIKDIEGLTAFDLYNGTVEGTNPPHDVDGSDVYVWGVNRNFALGTGDSGDKAYADRVNLLTQNQASGKPDPIQRFFHIGVKDVHMAKLHTAVVTTESKGNLSLCGFGSNGRLGRNIHSQLALTPMPDFPHSIVSVALGQDHTLALTSGGYILSWGHNRFSQLGYVIEQPETPLARGKEEIEVQVSPKRIVGLLKKEFVQGVAAGRMASACWTSDALYTWGTNAGHLGYDKVANPVQTTPRKVPAIAQGVLDVALSDYAMVCLVDTNEVICFHHDANFKISFPIPRSGGFGYRPPHLANKAMIKKVTSSAVTFAAMSSLGDVFTFSLPNPLEDISKDAKERHVNVKPQLIWGLRKKFTAAQDVAIGSDGTAIVCTTSGHVYVRQRVKSGAGQLKFRRIPYLQRIVKVACNESGAFAAVRVDARAPQISLKGPTLEDDLFLLQPHFRRFDNQMTAEDFDREKVKVRVDEDDEDESANSVSNDTAVAIRMCTVLTRWRKDDNDSLFSWSEPLLGSDIWLVAGGLEIPAHSIMLMLRVPAFQRILRGDKVPGLKLSGSKIITQARHPIVILLLLQYIYTDELAAFWDARVARIIQDKFKDLKLAIGDIKADLRLLADSFDLPPLSTLLNSASKVAMPKHTLSDNLLSFFASSHTSPSPPAACDTTLVLADDKQVACSSVLLRSRCPFFEAMFEDRDWTAPRAEDQGRVVIHMEHLKWRPMNLVFKYLHGGKEDDLFDYHHQETLDEFLDFVFEVLAAATELLIDRLVLVCSRVIIRHCNAFNAAALACEAAFYQAHTLKLSIFDFIVASMETMLESGLLDEMDEDVLLELCRVIGKKQEVRLGVSRDGALLAELIGKWGDWLALQDIPAPRLRAPYKPRVMRSPKLSPLDATFQSTNNKDKGKRRTAAHTPSPVVSPELRSQPTGTDDIFAMDEEATSPPSTASGRQTPGSSRPMTPLDLHSGSSKSGQVPWKSRTVESGRVDLRSIMAETEASSKTPTRPPIPSTPSSIMSANRSSPVLSAFSPSKPTPIRSPPSAGGPWRQVEQQRPSLSSVQASQSASSLPTAPVSAGTPSRPGPSTMQSQTQASPIPQRTPSSASKVFTPTKVPSASNVPRKPSSGSAWTSAASFAPPAPIAVSPTAQSLSLLQIQQQEQDYLQRAKKPTTRSFAEIIEQEEKDRKEDERKAAEIEYDRWLQSEIARNETGPSSSRGGGGGGRGRGRGGGEKQRKVPNRGKDKSRGGGSTGTRESASAGFPKDSATGRIDDEPAPAETRSPAKPRGGSRGGGRGGSGRGRGRGGTGAGADHGGPRQTNGHTASQPLAAAPTHQPTLTAQAAPFYPST